MTALMTSHGHDHEHGAAHGGHHGPHAHRSARPGDREGHGGLLPAAASASVAIDVGGGRGALVLYPSERYRDREIEISRAGDQDARVHTGVHERSTQQQTLLTAIFGSLPAGDYVVWQDAATQGPAVTVHDGAVAEIHLV